MSLSTRAFGCLIFVTLLGWQVFLAWCSTFDFAAGKTRTVACAGWLKQNVMKYSGTTDESQRKAIIDEINSYPCRGFGASPENTYLSIKGTAEGEDWPLIIDRPGNHLTYGPLYFGGIVYMNDWRGINAGYRDGHIEFFSKADAISLISSLYADGATIVDAEGGELRQDELFVVNSRLSFHPYRGTWHPSLLLVLLVFYGIFSKWLKKSKNENITKEGQQGGTAPAGD